MDLHDLAQPADRGLTILLLVVTAGAVIFIVRAFWIELPPSREEIKALHDGIARSRQIRREEAARRRRS
jgi:hypothetical protein